MLSHWPLTLRGTGAVAVSIVCIVLAQRFALAELLYLATLLIVLVAASAATLYLVPSSERVSRSFEPDVAAVGTEVTVRVRVEIRSPLPSAQGQWQDTLPSGLYGEAFGLVPPTSKRRGTAADAVTVAYSVETLRRGIHPVGPLSLLAIDPFGLARRRRLVGRADSLTVTPAIVDLGPLVDQPGEAGGGMHATTDRLGQGTDNLIPRHYTPGDSMRRIHWRASAHRGELMVRQEEQETTPEAMVVLDRSGGHWSVEATRTPGADPGFETAVCACASVTAQLVREGYLVTVIDGSGAALSEPIDGGDLAALEQLAIDLATVRAHRDSTLGGLVGLLAGGSVGPLVVVTGAIGEADAALLAPLARHSALPVLIAVAPRVELTHGALTRTARAGWRTAVAPTEDDLAAAWADTVDRGARHAAL